MASGIICLWYGAIVDIPAGWTLCDGTAGTPDLRDRFVIGAEGLLPVGTAAGANLHLHTIVFRAHQHFFTAGANRLAFAAPFNILSTFTQPTGSINFANSVPTFKSLAFIMRV